MGEEINLLANYPSSKRNLDERLAVKSPSAVAVARQFGKDFFDGDRLYGYGGFYYNPRFWETVVPTFQTYYGLTSSSKVLDVGCAKGFMLFDFYRLIPGIILAGLDISDYAIENAKEEVKSFLKVGNAVDLPYEDKFFDLVISINTVHNLNKKDCVKALLEIERVSQKGKFITVDAYHNDEEKKRMDMWNLTALTYMSTSEWQSFFNEVGYTGDYYWFIP